MHTKVFIAPVLLLSLLACSTVDDQKDGATSATSDNTETKHGTGSMVKFQGGIVSAFAVTVDGTEYRDMESFYTAEVSRLPQKIRDAGYADPYTGKFEAELGFRDLFANMQVYLASVADRGYQAAATVRTDGNFEISLPETALDAEYRIRANKRISVVLNNGEVTKRICYNFSAIEGGASFTKTDKPLLLSNFETSLTAYECPSESESSGVTIPNAPNTNQVAAKIAVGSSKDDVISILGRKNLEQRSATLWCWNIPTTDLLGPCAERAESECTCSVQFDSIGKLSHLENIAPAFMK